MDYTNVNILVVILDVFAKHYHCKIKQNIHGISLYYFSQLTACELTVISIKISIIKKNGEKKKKMEIYLHAHMNRYPQRIRYSIICISGHLCYQKIKKVHRHKENPNKI